MFVFLNCKDILAVVVWKPGDNHKWCEHLFPSSSCVHAQWINILNNILIFDRAWLMSTLAVHIHSVLLCFFVCCVVRPLCMLWSGTSSENCWAARHSTRVPSAAAVSLSHQTNSIPLCRPEWKWEKIELDPSFKLQDLAFPLDRLDEHQTLWISWNLSSNIFKSRKVCVKVLFAAAEIPLRMLCKP